MIAALVVAFAVGGSGSVSAQSGVDGDILGMRGFSPVFIEIARTDTTTTLVLEDGQWQLTSPFQERADQQAVARLLDQIRDFAVADVLEGSPEEFGFDAPQATLTMRSANGDEKVLVVGDFRSPVSLYVKSVQADEVFAVSNVGIARLGEYPNEFIDRLLAQVDPADVIELYVAYTPRDIPEEIYEALETLEEELETIGFDEVEETAMAEHIEAIFEDELFQDEAGPKEFFLRREGGVWLFTEESTVAFDVDGLLRSIRLIQAVGKAGDEDLEGVWFYPAPDTASVELVTRSSGTRQLHIGSETADGLYRYVKVDDREDIYLIPSFFGRYIVDQAGEINENLLSVDLETVSQLTVELGDRSEAVFRRNSDGAWEANRAVVFNMDPLLDAVASVSARRIAPLLEDESAYGFGDGERAVRISVDFVNRTNLLLWLGAMTPDGDGIYVRTSGREGVYIGFPESVDEIASALDGVRTNLFPVSADNVVALTVSEVSNSGDVSEIRIERSGGQWQRGSEVVDASGVNSLLTEMQNLGADSLPPWPDDSDELGFYPAPGSIRITVEDAEGTELSLDVGAVVEVGSGWFATRNYYVTVSDLEDLTFVREQAMRRITDALGKIR